MSPAGPAPELPGKTPPHSLEAERAVLGTILLYPLGPELTMAAELELTADDFYKDAHRTVYREMRRLSDRGTVPDLLTLTDHLRQLGVLEDVGGQAAFATMLEETSTAPMFSQYVEIILEHSRKRTLARIFERGSDESFNGGSSRVIVERTRRDLETLDVSALRGAGRLVFTPLADLLREPEEAVAWLVEDRLPTAGLSILAGKPKAGKSTTARCLALAVASGKPWLGWATSKGPVFYLALEEKRAEVQAHFRAMGGTDEDVRVFVAPSPDDGLRRLREATERERPALIIIDPVLRFVRVRDANDYAVVTRALEPVMTLARDTKAHVQLVHHLGKGDREGGDAILGSTAIYGAVDTALILKRTEHYRTLQSRQRYGPDLLEEIILELDPVTRWVSAGPSRKDADRAKAATAIMDYLKGQREAVEESVIDEAVEGKKAVKVAALRELVARGVVLREGGGKRGDPYKYRLADGAPRGF